MALNNINQKVKIKWPLYIIWTVCDLTNRVNLGRKRVARAMLWRHFFIQGFLKPVVLLNNKHF